MFDALLKSIYNKIDSIKNKKIKAKAIKKLEESILTNKTYKHQFENLTIITEAKDKKRAVELIKELAGLRRPGMRRPIERLASGCHELLTRG